MQGVVVVDLLLEHLAEELLSPAFVRYIDLEVSQVERRPLDGRVDGTTSSTVGCDTGSSRGQGRCEG